MGLINDVIPWRALMGGKSGGKGGKRGQIYFTGRITGRQLQATSKRR